jgi:anti-sigma factor RsiW
VNCDDARAMLDARGPGAAEPAPPALRAHLADCPACATHERFVHALAAALAAEPVPALPPDLVARTRLRATRALRAHTRAPGPGLIAEVVAVLAVLALALPLVLAHAWLVADVAVALLGGLLPPLVLEGLGAVYFASLALAVGTLYALLPIWVATARRVHKESA